MDESSATVHADAPRCRSCPEHPDRMFGPGRTTCDLCAKPLVEGSCDLDAGVESQARPRGRPGVLGTTAAILVFFVTMVVPWIWIFSRSTETSGPELPTDALAPASEEPSRRPAPGYMLAGNYAGELSTGDGTLQPVIVQVSDVVEAAGETTVTLDVNFMGGNRIHVVAPYRNGAILVSVNRGLAASITKNETVVLHGTQDWEGILERH